MNKNVLCHCFGGYAEPGIVCHPDSFVVAREEVVALMPVSVFGLSMWWTEYCSKDVLLNVFRHVR